MIDKNSINNYSEAFGGIMGALLRRERIKKEQADRMMFQFAILFTSVELLLDIEEAAWRLIDAVDREEVGADEYKALFGAVRKYREAFREGQ